MNSLLAYQMRTTSKTRTGSFSSTGIDEEKNVPLIKAIPETSEM